MTKPLYVNQLPEEQQKEIEDTIFLHLHTEGYEPIEIEDAIERAMCSKIHDLEEVIDIQKYLGGTKND